MQPVPASGPLQDARFRAEVVRSVNAKVGRSTWEEILWETKPTILFRFLQIPFKVRVLRH